MFMFIAGNSDASNALILHKGVNYLAYIVNKPFARSSKRYIFILPSTATNIRTGAVKDKNSCSAGPCLRISQGY
jgi:hypothetical protein